MNDAAPEANTDIFGMHIANFAERISQEEADIIAEHLNAGGPMLIVRGVQLEDALPHFFITVAGTGPSEETITNLRWLLDKLTTFVNDPQVEQAWNEREQSAGPVLVDHATADEPLVEVGGKTMPISEFLGTLLGAREASKGRGSRREGAFGQSATEPGPISEAVVDGTVPESDVDDETDPVLYVDRNTGLYYENLGQVTTEQGIFDAYLLRLGGHDVPPKLVTGPDLAQNYRKVTD